MRTDDLFIWKFHFVQTYNKQSDYVGTKVNQHYIAIYMHYSFKDLEEYVHAFNIHIIQT